MFQMKHTAEAKHLSEAKYDFLLLNDETYAGYNKDRTVIDFFGTDKNKSKSISIYV